MRSSAFISFALLALVLPFAAQANSHFASKPRHHGVAKRSGTDIQLHKRFSNARVTFYQAGLGACGVTNSSSDFIVALNAAQYGSGSPGPQCFKKIRIHFGGKTAEATIVDLCPGCPEGGLDLSEGLFSFFASQDVGVLSADWEFIDDETSPSSAFSSEPSSTASESQLSSSSRTSSSSLSSSSRTSSSTSSSTLNLGAASGLAVPTGTVDPGAGNPANLNDMNQAIIGMGAMINAGSRAH